MPMYADNSKENTAKQVRNVGYNILLFMQAVLAAEAGIEDRKSEEKRQREVDAHNAEAKVKAKAKKKQSKRKPRGLKAIHPMLLAVVQQCHPMTYPFIRCFRSLLRTAKPLVDCFNDYKPYMEKYL